MEIRLANGFYSITFGTPLGEAAGVITLDEGRLQGGDAIMFYLGSYAAEGSRISGNVRIARHATLRDLTSVFGVDEADIEFTGVISAEGRIAGTAISPQAPGIEMVFAMRPLDR